MNNESHRRRKNIHRWIIKTELVRISHLSTSTSLLKHIDGEKFFFEAFAHEDEHLRLTMRVPVEVMIFATFEVFVAATEHLALPSVITGRTWVWRSIACLHNHYCVEIMQCSEKDKHLSTRIIRQTFNAWRIYYCKSNSNILKNTKIPKSQFSSEGLAFNCSVPESPLVFCNNLHLTLSTLYKTVQLLR